MDMKRIDDLPNLVQAGTISTEEAVKKIAEYIYREPYRFGLAGFDDDFKSEIILTVLQKAHRFSNGSTKIAARSVLTSTLSCRV